MLNKTLFLPATVLYPLLGFAFRLMLVTAIVLSLTVRAVLENIADYLAHESV